MKRLSFGDRVFYFINYIILSFFLLVVSYPLIYIISCSFSSSSAVVSGRVFLWPVEPTLIGHTTIFENNRILVGFANSFLYAVTGTILAGTVTMFASYPLSRNDFILRKQIMFIFTFTMFFGGGLIPTYMLIKKLGLIDTRAVMIIPGAVSVYNIIITRTYIKSNIPTELLDAARIDGCSDFQFFLRIVLPLSKTIMAVVALFYAVGIWNSYFNALIYLTRQQLYPLQIILREILIQNKVDAEMISKGRINVKDLAARQAIFELLKYSLIVVSSAPVFVIYPFIQKYFVKGIMIGSLKG